MPHSEQGSFYQSFSLLGGVIFDKETFLRVLNSTLSLLLNFFNHKIFFSVDLYL